MFKVKSIFFLLEISPFFIIHINGIPYIRPLIFPSYYFGVNIMRNRNMWIWGWRWRLKKEILKRNELSRLKVWKLWNYYLSKLKRLRKKNSCIAPSSWCTYGYIWTTYYILQDKKRQMEKILNGESNFENIFKTVIVCVWC